MSASNDRNAGTNPGRIRGQVEQITNWMDGAEFEHVPGGSDIDRVIAEIDWRAEVDPTLTASTNYAIIKDRLGLKTATDLQTERRNAEQKAEDSARRAIRENLEAIDAGEADELLADIRAEYGAEFVTVELEQARAEADVEVGGAPEPKDWSPSAIGATATEPPESAPARDSTPAPEPERPSDIPEPEPAPGAVTTPEPAQAPEPVLSRGLARAGSALAAVGRETRALARDIVGGVRLYREYRRQGRPDRPTTDRPNQPTLGDYANA